MTLGHVKVSWIVVAFAIGVACHAWFYVTTILALPDISDEYARAWQFQLTMFAIFRLPIWVIAFLLVLLFRLRSLSGSESK